MHQSDNDKVVISKYGGRAVTCAARVLSPRIYPASDADQKIPGITYDLKLDRTLPMPAAIAFKMKDLGRKTLNQLIELKLVKDC